MKETGVDIHEAVSLSVKSQNQVERVRGYSPAQWALGRQPTWTEELHDGEDGDTVNLGREGTEAFAKRMAIQARARAIAEEELLNERLLRAQKAKHRKDRIFCPGDTVFAWRYGMEKTKGQGQKRGTGLNKGAWYGPAVVLGTETTELDGERVPGSIIWVVVNGRLWRCAPQQLRRASEREVAEETLMQRRPWTFENIVKDMHIHEYTDVTGEQPPPEEPEEEEADEGPPMADDENQPAVLNPAIPKRRRVVRKTPQSMVGSPDWAAANEAARRAMESITTAFFTQEETPENVIEVAFPFLDSPHKLRRYLRSPESFVVTSLRKQRVEVSEKRLNPEERELIRLAKGKEVREFIKEQVVRRLLADERVKPEDAMRMRFVLTWKKDPDSPGGKRGKARLVVLGFQDPYLGQENTCSPTLNKRSKQMLTQVQTSGSS
jgi:hypothetical protein